MEKISYERRVYESVDDESISQGIFQNLTGNSFQAVKGQIATINSEDKRNLIGYQS